MPEVSSSKYLPHPGKRAAVDRRGYVADTATPYGEIQVTTNFTFLVGASHAEELVDRAAALGYQGLAVTDTNTLAGAVRMHVAAKQVGLPLAIGSRLRLALPRDGATLSVLVYPTNRAGYGRLCQLLTRGKLRASKGECHLTLGDLLDDHDDLLAVVISPFSSTAPKAGDGASIGAADEAVIDAIDALKRVFTAQRLSIAATYAYGSNDRERLAQTAAMAEAFALPLAATNDVQYHTPNRKPLHDVLACIRAGVTLGEAGFLLKPNAEQHLKSPAEMHRLFADYPRAIARSLRIIEQASAFSLDQLRYEYPHETCPAELTPIEHLTALTWQGAAERYPRGVPMKVRQIIEHELSLIAELDYPHYFLTVHDIVCYARQQGILCQGRGAAANSAVCFCLGVTEVDPDRIATLFERFISKERDEPPDIDIDFEHERREQVIQYIYRKYGRHRAALTAEVITYRSRSAIRDVGKALGLSLDCVDRLARHHEWFDAEGVQPTQLRELGMNPDDPTLCRLAFLVKQILGFPRHLSQHVGGFVLTERPLCETVPIENAAMPQRTVIEWDKDDIDALGMLKVDVLGLGMLTCVRKSFDMIEQHTGTRHAMYRLPAEDPAVYEMITRADTVGVFQIESRAQMSMLPRLQPRTFYDLVIEVAIVRPGPIQGGMVHPYLRRRTGEEQVTYPSDAVRDVLERTLGVPLFQEQAMALAIRAAGFTPGEADQLRRAMAAWKRKGHLLKRFGGRIIRGMLANGYDRAFAERCFEQIKGFGEYGFPESHAASFALIVYVSAWLKHHHPAAFAASLINSQPMGFYAPAQIVRDAKEHGIEVRPVDVNHSAWDCTLEQGDGAGRLALRLGMRLVRGLQEQVADRIAQAVVQHGRFDDVESLRRASAAPVVALRRLASADAFASMGLDRQHALWVIRRLRDQPLPLFDQVITPAEPDARLPRITLPHRVLHDYTSTGLSLKAHPLSFLRPRLDQLGVTRNVRLLDSAACPDRMPIIVAGLVLIRQRPSTASGIVFMTIEDETGIANLIFRPRIFDRYRRAANHSHIILARGSVERDTTTGRVVHVMVHAVHDLDRPGAPLKPKQRNFH